MPDLAAWMRSQGRVYFGNAATKRDLRVQLRGNKAILLWTFYLVVFVAVAIYTYSQIAAAGRHTSISYAQAQLQTFYYAVLALLGGIVSVIAPALGATAIVSERQRRSLDLVFTAPVSAKYYLVGKLLSTYRYIWMLLLLSLPVVSVGVIMGGATWADVAKTLLIISIDALLFSAIALGISAGATKLTTAVILSYLVVGIICMFTVSMTASMAFMGMRSHGKSLPVFFLFSPFTAAYGADSTTLLFGTEVPNVALFCPIAAAVLFVIILAAGSALSPWHVKESKWLRIIGLGLAGLFGYLVGPTFAFSPSVSADDVAKGLAGLGLAILPVVPFLACYIKSEPPKFEYDGRSRLKKIFTAAPSGALPYVLAMPLFLSAGFLSVQDFSKPDIFECILYATVFLVGLYALVWSISRFSSRVATNLSASRGLTIVFTMAILFVPTVLVSATSYSGSRSPFEKVIPLAIFYARENEAVVGLVSGGFFAVVAYLIARGTEKFRAEDWRLEN